MFYLWNICIVRAVFLTHFIGEAPTAGLVPQQSFATSLHLVML
jgi:hypothetical protein